MLRLLVYFIILNVCHLDHHVKFDWKHWLEVCISAKKKHYEYMSLH